MPSWVGVFRPTGFGVPEPGGVLGRPGQGFVFKQSDLQEKGFLGIFRFCVSLMDYPEVNVWRAVSRAFYSQNGRLSAFLDASVLPKKH